jgi:hypothetical protein
MSSYPLTVSERCSCGAEFTWTDDTGATNTAKGTNAKEAVKDWRKNHKHAFPPVPPPIYIPPFTTGPSTTPAPPPGWPPGTINVSNVERIEP